MQAMTIDGQAVAAEQAIAGGGRGNDRRRNLAAARWPCRVLVARKGAPARREL